MKTILKWFGAAMIFASCNSGDKTESPETTPATVGTSDTAALKNNTVADTAHFAPPVVVVPETVRTVTHIVTNVPKKTVVKHNPAPATSTTKTETPAPVTQGTATTTETPTSTTPATTAPAPVPAKKGWSSAAKDATIGGVGGAVAGAVISKKKGKGAIIGGALGAAGGYILGRKKDKKAQAADTLQ